MAYQLKHAARVALKVLSAAVDPLFGSFPGPRILIYHQVGTGLGREMEVSTEAFVEHVGWMESHGEIVDLDTAITRRGESDADRLFVVTFDDGFQDVYDNGFPLLKRRGVPFTLYLTTRPIQTGEPLDPRYPAARPLTWDQVNEMAESGLATIGAHTHTHPDLRDTTPSEIADDLDRSNELIRLRTGVDPRHFTYPWGWWSREADPLVRERYDSATVGGGPPIVDGADLFRLSRVPIQQSDSERVFRCRMATGLRLEAAARSAVDRYLR